MCTAHVRRAADVPQALRKHIRQLEASITLLGEQLKAEYRGGRKEEEEEEPAERDLSLVDEMEMDDAEWAEWQVRRGRCMGMPLGTSGADAWGCPSAHRGSVYPRWHARRSLADGTRAACDARGCPSLADGCTRPARPSPTAPLRGGGVERSGPPTARQRRPARGLSRASPCTPRVYSP